ncbi:MAG: putative minor tail protein [Prokaryotic dsDNA virus sp.]|nr:MAG: putative minor tail protein [Prokaryotic dsDNA virus sp.]|tara:strand:+ start:6305 stop:8584 length:2280 start_codon:yes stop_codon:yes gene_type:complete
MAKTVRLKFEVEGAREAQNQTKGVESSLTGLAKKAGGVALAFFGTQGLVNAFTSATRTGAEFEQNLKNLGVISGATGGKLRQLEQSALRLGGSTKFTASEVANLQIEFSKLGFTSDEILQVTEGTLNLSTAFGTDLASTAEIAGSTLRAFGLDASETTRLTDVMASSFSSTALDISKFSNSMSFVAPVASVAGFSIEDTTAILGTLANAGISGSMAGTALRTVFLDLTNSSSKLSKELGSGIDSVDDLEQALIKLKNSGMPTEQMLQLVDKRAVSAFSILLEGAGSIGELASEFENATGTGQRMATEMLDTLESKFAILNSATDDLKIAFFETFDDALKASIDRITEAIGAVSEFFKQLDESPLQTAIRDIEALGGNTADLRLELAETNLELAKQATEGLPSISEATKELADNTQILIDIAEQRRVAEENASIDISKAMGAEKGVAIALRNAGRERIKELNKEQEAIEKRNEQLDDSIKKQSALITARKSLKDVNDEINKAQQKSNDLTSEDPSLKPETTEIKLKEVDLLKEKLEMLQLGLTQQEAEASLVEFQLANAEAFGLSEEKRLQLQIKSLQLEEQFQKQAKSAQDLKNKSAKEDEQRRKDEITQLIANANNAEEALEKKVRAEASNALASLVRSVFESTPFPLNFALAGGVAVGGTKLIDGLISSAKAIKLRQGGMVDGFGGGDRVPALLERGEFVLNKEAVQNIGISNLESLNAQKPSGGVNLTFNAPVTNEDFVKDFIVPTINDSVSNNFS